METVKAALNRLNNWQHHLLHIFFDEVEDRAADICAHLEVISCEKIAGMDVPALHKLYEENKLMVKELEKMGEEERERLKKEGVPYLLTDPIRAHAFTRVKLAAKKYLQTPSGG